MVIITNKLVMKDLLLNMGDKKGVVRNKVALSTLLWRQSNAISTVM